MVKFIVEPKQIKARGLLDILERIHGSRWPTYCPEHLYAHGMGWEMTVHHVPIFGPQYLVTVESEEIKTQIMMMI